jgi:16S rRNA (cytosine1402-N4)-methyltransferase
VDATSGHVPVMLAEVLEHLAPRPGEVMLDGTAGGGGHAAALMNLLKPDGRLILLDRDREALERLMDRFGRGGDVRYFHANFCDIDQVVAEAGEGQLDGVLLDVGISSLQLDEADRGFSFDRPGPLDMRLDRTQRLSAEEIVNRWPAEKLADLFRTYGDQPFPKRIAQAIVAARRLQPIRQTDELARIVTSSLPAAFRRAQRMHPATRVFQALRIAVNEELASLDKFFDKVFDCMKPGGRVVVIAFHSGEDRIVKNRLRQAALEGRVRLAVSKPITPTPEEVRTNPRSRSARLRVATVLRAAG